MYLIAYCNCFSAVLNCYRRESTNSVAEEIPMAWVMQSNWGINFFSVVFRYIISNDEGTIAYCRECVCVKRVCWRISHRRIHTHIDNTHTSPRTNCCLRYLYQKKFLSFSVRFARDGQAEPGAQQAILRHYDGQAREPPRRTLRHSGREHSRRRAAVRT